MRPHCHRLLLHLQQQRQGQEAGRLAHLLAAHHHDLPATPQSTQVRLQMRVLQPRVTQVRLPSPPSLPPAPPSPT